MTQHQALPSRRSLAAPPNKHMQRAGKHKVLGRGRSGLVPCSASSARVLKGQPAGADVNRWATEASRSVA
jgi:hypothetical protein